MISCIRGTVVEFDTEASKMVVDVGGVGYELEAPMTTFYELPETGKDEVSVLTRSFNRLRRSLEKAMTMIEE